MDSEDLPEELAVLAMRAALCAFPHVRHQDSPTRDTWLCAAELRFPDNLVPAPRCMLARLIALMSHLPVDRHHLAIRAYRDASARCDRRGDCDPRAILLPLHGFSTAACITKAVALLPANSVTSLSMTSLGLAREDSTPGKGDEQEREEYEAAQLALRGVFAPLASLTALVDLDVELGQDNRWGYEGLGCRQRWADSFYDPLGKFLGKLTQLTRVRVVNEMSTCVSCEALVPGLGQLTGLRSLEMINYDVMIEVSAASGEDVIGSDSDSESFVLGDALSYMSVLTHLSLRYCPLDCQRQFVLPVVRRLPLLSLDVTGCELGGLHFELPGLERRAATGHESFLHAGSSLDLPLPWSSWQCLRVSYDIWSDDDAVDQSPLSHMTCLTELGMKGVGGFDDVAFVHFLRCLNCPRLQTMHFPDVDAFGNHVERTGDYITNGGLQRSVDMIVREICTFIGKCPELQTVGIDAVFYAGIASIMRSLAMLPHLCHLKVTEAADESYVLCYLDEFSGVGNVGESEKFEQYAARCQGLTELSLVLHPDRAGIFSGLMRGVGKLALLRALELEYPADNRFDEVAPARAELFDSVHLVAALSCLTGLTRLQLLRVCFTKSTLLPFAIANSLACMSRLQDFRLEHYRVGIRVSDNVDLQPEEWSEYRVREISIKDVIHIMPSLHSLSTLILSSADHLHQEELEELLSVLPQMRALRLLHLVYVPNAPGDIQVETALAGAVCPGVEVVVIGTAKDTSMFGKTS